MEDPSSNRALYKLQLQIANYTPSIALSTPKNVTFLVRNFAFLLIILIATALAHQFAREYCRSLEIQFRAYIRSTTLWIILHGRSKMNRPNFQILGPAIDAIP